MISHGRLVAQGSLDELTRGRRGAGVGAERRSGPAAAPRSPRQDGVTAEPGEAAGGWLAVRGASLEDVGTTALESGVAVFELYRPRQSLESVFLELTSGTEAGR